jgi:D-alanine-D-alanine ligase
MVVGRAGLRQHLHGRGGALGGPRMRSGVEIAEGRAAAGNATGRYPRRVALRVGLVYDLIGTWPHRPGDPADADAEFEPEATVELLENALLELGHGPLRIGSSHDLLARIGKGELPPLDAALSIAEGTRGRDREAWAPVLLQMAGVPTLGSDALTLSVSLDKAWAATLVEAAGIPVPPRAVVRSVAELEGRELPVPFPLFVKPRGEGTAKGIAPSSRVEDRAALRREVERVTTLYRQPALVEAFLPGAEYTVTVVGNDPPRALPVLQRALEARTGIGLHAVERHSAPAGGWRHVLPGGLDAEREAELGALAVRAYEALECLDFARADFKLDSKGRPRFLEMNPLPTFDPQGSFGILAELEGRPAHELVAEVLAAGLRRLGLT